MANDGEKNPAPADQQVDRRNLVLGGVAVAAATGIAWCDAPADRATL